MNAKLYRCCGIGICFMLAGILLALAYLSLPAALADPGILYVAPGGNCGAASPCYGDLQSALDAAVAGDEVRMAAGMYPIEIGEDQVARVEKSLVIKGGYTTSDWNIPDPSGNPTTLNALSQGRVLVISGTLEVTLHGLRLVYGNAEGLGGYTVCYSDHDAGGGLYINQASVTLNQTWVMTNTTPDNGFGGGVYAVDATLQVSNGTVIQANYGGAGGGFYLNNTDASLSQVSVLDNFAGGPWGGCQHGGGGFNIVYDSQVEIIDSTIRGNRKQITTNGAGILFQDGRLVLRESLIEENEGAAVHMVSYQAGSDGANATLTGNVIQNNSGTGVAASSFAAHNAITMTGNLVQGNHTDGFAGGISVDTVALLTGNTILNNYTSGNSSFKGGGVYLNGSQNNPIVFRGNIVRGNHSSIGSGATGGGIYVEGENVTLDSNIVQSNSAYAGISDYSGSGGGIFVAGDVTLINNVVTDNSVGGPNGRGAGITVAGAQAMLSHNTIARNTGGNGSGVFVTYLNQPGLPVLYNTIIAEQAIGIHVSSSSPQNMATLYGVLWWGNGANSSGSAFVFDELSGDPAFVDADGMDYHITPASAAIDTGRDDAGILTDMDSENRPHYSGYDLGADEWVPLATVKSASTATAQTGDLITYTLILTNATAAPMSVILTDTLPAEVAFVGSLEYNNGNGSYAAGVVSWSGEVPTTTASLITWQVQVEDGVPGGTSIVNHAEAQDAYGWFQTNAATTVVSVDYAQVYLPVVVRGLP